MWTGKWPGGIHGESRLPGDAQLRSTNPPMRGTVSERSVLALELVRGLSQADRDPPAPRPTLRSPPVRAALPSSDSRHS